MFVLAAVVLVASLAFAGLAFAKDDGSYATQAQATPAPGTGSGPGRGMGYGMRYGMTAGRGFGATLAPARSAGVGGRGMMMGQQGGILHEYMQDALAEALGLTRAELDSRVAAGERHFDIAADLGLTPDEFVALMTAARAQAIEAAMADGAITQAQADWMLQRTPGRGPGFGNCPMHPSNTQPSQAAPQS
jgi:hypothetical protein